MKVTIERTGGFAGMSTTFSVDDNTLNASEKQQLETLLDKSKFFEMPVKSSEEPSKGAADYFIYRITAESEPGKSHTVERTDLTMDSSLKALVDILESKQD
jgi:hypothetical protein